MSRVTQVVRLVGIAGLFLLCLEAAARLDDHLTWGAPLFGPYHPELLRDQGPDGVPRNVPGARFEKWRINGYGFRGAEIEREKGPGRKRVIVLGQSESFGLYESEGGEWPERLARLATGRWKDVEVLNASVVGTGRWSRSEYLDRYVLPLRPDVLVLVLNVSNEASADIVGRPAVSPRSPDSAMESTRNWPQSRVVPKLMQRFKALLPPRLVQEARTWRLQRALQRKEREILDGRSPLDQIPPEAVAGYEAHLRDLVGGLRLRGVQPVLATYPTLVHAENIHELRVLLLAARTYHEELSEAGLLDAAVQYNDATRRVAQQMGVPLVDLDAEMPRTPEYFVDQVHYTDRGAQFVAERVLEILGDAVHSNMSAGE